MATIPTQGPIDLSTIRDAINASGGHATNDLISFFSAENVAEGSPRKPISLGVDFAQDFDSTKPNYSPNFWQDGGKYGWNWDNALISGPAPFASLPAKYDGNKANGWERVLPTGGASSPYRLGDFLGYIADALPLVSSFNCPEVVYVENGNFLISVDTPIEDASVEFAELGNFGNYYFGVLLYQSAGRSKRLTATENISAGMFSIMIDISQFSAYSYYTVMPFLSNMPIGISDNDPAGLQIYTLPNVDAKTLRIWSVYPDDSSGISLSATIWMYRDSGSNELRFGWDVKASSSRANVKEFYPYIQIIYGDESFDNAEGQTIYSNTQIDVNPGMDNATVWSGYTAANFLNYPLGTGLKARVWFAEDLILDDISVENRT